MHRKIIADHEMRLSEMDKILYSEYVIDSSRDIDQIEMYKARVKELCHLLLNAQQERDEARQQLQKSTQKISDLKKLLNTYMSSTSKNHTPEPTIFEDQSGFINCIFSPNSSTPADCISDAANNYNNSTALSAVSLGTEYSGYYNNLGLLHKSSNVHGPRGLGRVRARTSWSNELMLDHASVVIDNLVKGKALPEKGKLVQAVQEAEPLLEKLILTGHIPRWRNPPTLPSVRAPVPDSVSSQYQKSLQHQSLRGSGR